MYNIAMLSLETDTCNKMKDVVSRAMEPHIIQYKHVLLHHHKMKLNPSSLYQN